MQPYFFPYIGYFELMASVDLFVFLEDVQFTRRGWINRNRISSQHGEYQHLTLPVSKCARETRILDVQCVPDWKGVVVRKIRKTYGDGLHRAILDSLPCETTRSLSGIIKHSLISLASFLRIRCDFASSAGISQSRSGERILDICRHFGADEYFNLSGGSSLYRQDDFGNVKLRFMRPTDYPNKLSIIDAIAECENAVRSRLSLFQRGGEA